MKKIELSIVKMNKKSSKLWTYFFIEVVLKFERHEQLQNFTE